LAHFSRTAHVTNGFATHMISVSDVLP